jgi:hypothetical protein
MIGCFLQKLPHNRLCVFRVGRFVPTTQESGPGRPLEKSETLLRRLKLFRLLQNAVKVK